MSLILPATSLAKRELVRFIRQPARVIGALVTPLVFWLFIGAGMGHSFHADAPGGDRGFIVYFYPGTILMILLFTAIFSTISIIEDRREGFLQSVLVAPVPRLAIVLGKTLGGTILATTQAILFLLLAPLTGIHLTIESFFLSIGVMLIVSFALTALGVCIAWRMSSTQGFHVIMNLFLMPMWFLSGSLFPIDGVSFAPLRWIMRLNPLTYGLSALQRALYWKQTLNVPNLSTSISISAAFAIVMLLVASTIARTRVSADLQ